MKNIMKNPATGVLVIIVLVIVAYMWGQKQGERSVQPQQGGDASLTQSEATGNTTKFTHFRVGNRNVKDLLLDGDNVWVGTSGGVIRYTPKKDEHLVYDVNNGLLSNGIFHLSKLDDRLVVGTYGGGLSLLDSAKNQWETFNIPDGLGDAFIYDVLKLSNGDVWIATWSGANRIRGGDLRDRSKWDLYTVSNTNGGLPNDWVYGLAEGKNGEVWLATEGGLARFKDGAWSNWAHKDGLGAPYEKVKSAIAFKTDPSKVSKHHARQKVEMGLSNVDISYNPNYIVALLVDDTGTVWCGTWGGGLSRYDGKSWTSITTEEGLPSNHVFMLHQDKKKRLWVGTSHGLAQYKNGAFKVYTTKDGLFSNTVFTMESTANDYWIGGYGGVTYLRDL